MDSPTFLPTLEAAAARGRVRHYPMLLYVASLSVLRRRSQVVRQRSAKPPFVGSIPTGASLSHKNLGPPYWRPFRLLGSFLGRFCGFPLLQSEVNGGTDAH